MIFALWVENVHSTTHLEEKVFSLPLPPPPPLLPFSYYFSNLLKRRRASSTTWSLDCAEGRRTRRRRNIHARPLLCHLHRPTTHPPTDRRLLFFFILKKILASRHILGQEGIKRMERKVISSSLSLSLLVPLPIYIIHKAGGRTGGRERNVWGRRVGRQDWWDDARHIPSPLSLFISI